MFLLWNTSRPALTSCSPIQTVNRGLIRFSATAAMRSASSVGVAAPCGVYTMTRPSTPRSAMQALVAFANRSTSASPSTSTGFPWLQKLGRDESRSATVFSESCASSHPYPITASAATTPGPPALVIIAILGPAGRNLESRTLAQLKRSRISSTRTIPALLKAASYAS